MGPQRQKSAEQWKYKNISEVTNDRLSTPRSVQSVRAHGSKPVKVVKVKSGRKKPFCNVRKYDKEKVKIENQEAQPDPYMSSWDQRVKLETESKKKWVAGQFIVTDHKAAVAKREQKVSLVCAVGEYPSHPAFERRDNREKFITPRGFRF